MNIGINIHSSPVYTEKALAKGQPGCYTGKNMEMRDRMEKRCYGCMRILEEQTRCPSCGWQDTDQNAAHQLPTGTVLQEKYLVGRVLGQGGFGITYLGWDMELRIPVAIKEYFPTSQVSRTYGASMVITGAQSADAFQEGKDRFLKEAQTLARLRHLHHIVQIHGYFQENNTAYIIMEYVDGITLQSHIRNRGRALEPEETFTILRPILQTMAQVHENGMIHRDISPDNIMLKTDGTVKILDFGTARAMDLEAGQLTHSTQAVLKNGFAPVEQYSAGRSLDQRADQYALCCTIYYCLTGRVPASAFDRYMDHTEIPWSRIPGLRPGQVRALEKGTALKAEDRYPNLRNLEEALFRAEEGPEPVPMTVPASQELSRQEIPRTVPADRIQPTVPAQEPIPATQPVMVPAEQPVKKKKPKWPIGVGAAVLVLALAGAGLRVYGQSSQYQDAQDALAQQNFDAAYEGFTALGSYRDSADMTTEVRYQQALWQLEKGEYAQAQETFVSLGAYKDSQDLISEGSYRQARTMLENGEYRAAYAAFTALGSYQDSQALKTEAFEKCIQTRTLDAGYASTIGVKPDGGTVVAGGASQNLESTFDELYAAMELIAVPSGTFDTEYSFSMNVVKFDIEGEDWKNVMAVSAGTSHVAALGRSGRVVVTGMAENGQDNVADVTEVVAVSAGGSHTVLLKIDGTVVARGSNSSQQCNVHDWTDIVAVAAGDNHTLGLKADGTVVKAGVVLVRAGEVKPTGVDSDTQQYGQVPSYYMEDICEAVYSWRNITAIAAGSRHNVGLRADGTVVAGGDNSTGACDVSSWKDIVAIDADSGCSVGLKADGTVVAAGLSEEDSAVVAGWTDIVTVSAGGGHVVGLKADGSLVSVGNNRSGQCDVAGWKLKVS